MKKNKIVILCTSILFSGCNYLDFDESTNPDKELYYSYFDNITSTVSGVYFYLSSDFGAIGGALREAATDNAVYTWENNKVYNIYNNTWSAINVIDDVWATNYKAIRSANSFLESFSLEPLKRFEWDDNYADNLKKAKLYPYEVRFLRAYFYFELIKRYGDVPLLLKTYNIDELKDIKKATFDQVVEFIVAECDEVAKTLPAKQSEFFGETGRATKGAAMALKSRALLYAASKLHNPNNDTEKWEKAARAAFELMQLGIYKLPTVASDPLYNKNGGNDVLASPQLIFERRNANTSSFEANNLPIGFEGANSGNTPSGNLADAYEWSRNVKGGEFTWAETDVVRAGFPYYKGLMQTRDPRFYVNIVANGSNLGGHDVETFVGGKNGQPQVGATLTGYYLKKYVNETVSLNPTKPVQKPHHYVLFRYAEILLNYAEAMSEWQGPNYTDIFYTKSARVALNEVRSSAQLASYTADGGDKDIFLEKVKKERRVELAFEDHRFWDIRRWKEGDLVKKIYGVKITKNEDGTYTYSTELVQTRQWNDKMYFYPIPEDQLFINKNLAPQNPGW